jgi:hypothetical protein
MFPETTVLGLMHLLSNSSASDFFHRTQHAIQCQAVLSSLIICAVHDVESIGITKSAPQRLVDVIEAKAFFKT